MLDLQHELKQIIKRNRDGGKATQDNRERMLSLFARQLYEAGYKNLLAHNLGERHVKCLVNRWKANGICDATMKNRMSVVRWWAQKVGRASVVARDNMVHGIGNRHYVTNEQKAQWLDLEKWRNIRDDLVQASVERQKNFGLRREEAIKFQPFYADQGDHIRLKPSWTKGGKGRIVEIRDDAQRELLNRLHKKVGKASLIPPSKTYIQQVKLYERLTKEVGLHKLHGLRHLYAQTLYEELTEWKAPAAGGKTSKELTTEEKINDREARLTISKELGHEREQITALYLGR